MLTDPIADFLTRMRNAQRANQPAVSAPKSKMKIALAEVMKKTRYIADYSVKDRNISVTFYPNKMELTLKRVSKPGQRIYVDRNSIPRVLNGMGISIISTSQGVMIGQEAKKKNLGGELICTIY